VIASAVQRIDEVVYTEASGTSLLADLYLPAGDEIRPVIIWLHGGGWRFGDRRLAPDLARYFAASGFAMVSIDYRLSSVAVFPAQLEDVQAAIGWVRANADRYSFGPIGLWGSSAGGHLAALAALTGDDVRAVVNGYGPVDFLQLDAHRGSGACLSADAPDSFESMLMGFPIQAHPVRVQAASPLAYVHASAPPMLILHGADDRIVPAAQSELLYEAMAAQDCDVTLCVTGGLGHGFLNNSEFDRVDPPSATVRRHIPGDGEGTSDGPPATFFMIEEFFREHLTSPKGVQK
jgi:acetyl esterase/lipase